MCAGLWMELSLTTGAGRNSEENRMAPIASRFYWHAHTSYKGPSVIIQLYEDNQGKNMDIFA